MDKGVFNIVIVLLIAVCFWIYILWKNSRKLNDDIRTIAQQQNLIRHDDEVRLLCRAIHLVSPHATAGVDYVMARDAGGNEAVIAQWKSDDPQPSAQAISDAKRELDSAYHEAEYAAMRRAEYPTIEEQLDAAWQARQGDSSKQREVDERIRQVKEKYPKTDECV